MKTEDHLQIEYAVRSARFVDGKLVQVSVQCADHGSAFAYDSEPLALHDLIELIKAGERVDGLWPAGQVWHHWPLEVVVLADGTESVESVDKNRPEGFVLSALQAL